ncbi:MAG: class I SAM-dependent rRNA methyltransferase [Candidatus Omnitrophica bacterium]|nr:class I SAM-dependent rRNA methyltransferase [Candidatus Omnitrophota bacterium]
MTAEIVLTLKGERWRRGGHPWVYRSDLKSADSSSSGEIVRVKGPGGRLLGQAFYNAASKIALRWLDDDPEKPIDRSFWEERLKAALRYREEVVKESTAYRLISSEADGFPGLIIDRYDSALVLQSLSLGIDRVVPLLVEILTGLLKPKAVVARNDSPVRSLEGLPVEKRLIAGEKPGRIEVTEGNRRYLVDVWEGQKTGAYLDQRENRLRARDYARGRVLDLFAYTGGFSLQVADRAEEVLAIDDSEWAVERLKENLALNRLANVRPERGNAFDRLRDLERAGERFDLIILDPPAFARNKQEVPDAWRGYREINLRALRVLAKGGTLFTCSCSYHIGDQIFLEILQEAAAGAGRPVRLLESRTQSRDHPILLTHPESKYLKCLVVQVAG